MIEKTPQNLVALLLLCTGCAPSAEESQKALMRYMEKRYPEDSFT